MERKAITIGREADNTVQINKPDISAHHVRITRTDANSFYVEDLDSSNHTFVDDMPIRKATIGLEEKLRLSKDTVIDLKEIFQIGDDPYTKPSKSEQIYIESFLQMKTLWDETERQKKLVRRKQQRKSAFIRLGIMLAIIGVAYPVCLMLQLQSVSFIIIIAAGAIAGAFTPVASTEEFKSIEDRLYRNYKCPHCGSKFGQKPWNHYADDDRCSNQYCKKSFKIINN